MPDLPPEAFEDHFHPPSIPTEVFCLHCHRTYESYLIEWREMDREEEGLPGMWCCPTAGCGGCGFGFDIHPVDCGYIDPDGRDLGQWCACDEDCTGDLDTCTCEGCQIERGELDSEEGDDDECEFVLVGGDDADDDDVEDEDDASATQCAGCDIPLDDLLPVNEAVGMEEISYELMLEIEEKLGFRAKSDAPSELRSPPSSGQQRRDHPPISEDDIPY